MNAPKAADIRTDHVPPLGHEVIYQDWYRDHRAIIVGHRASVYDLDRLLKGDLVQYGWNDIGVSLDLAYKNSEGKWVRVDDVNRQAEAHVGRLGRSWVPLKEDGGHAV